MVNMDEMCEICGVRKAKYECIRCGRKVCADDFWVMLGLCKLCVPESQYKEWKKKIGRV